MSAPELPDRRQLDFESVYDQFHAKIRRYLDRLVGASESEDVTQEVFVKVSQALPTFRGDSNLSTWMYRIATNTAYDKLRSPSSRRVGEPVEHDAILDDSPAAEQKLVRQEMNDCIGGYISRLPPTYRAVLILSEQQDLTNQEIADALGVTVDTVKIRLHRARARLKKELGDGCDFYRDDRNELACDPKRQGVSRRD